jgi:acetyl-CoA C-acetyltransferase
VEIAAHEIGIDITRPLTVTGGLSFAGGPWNNYVSHSIATMSARLRDDPGAIGLVSGNGGYITKHAFGIYSTEPPADGFRHRDLQAEVDALPSRAACEDPDGPASVESWTVMHDRDGNPETGLLAALLPDGRRAWGSTQDPAVVQAMATEELAGRKATLRPDGTFDLT